MTSSEAQSFLMGAEKIRQAFEFPKGGPVDQPGKVVEGPITDIGSLVQQRDYDDDSVLLAWPDGKPKMQLPVTIATNRNEPNEKFPEDDGRRRFWVKGNLQKAIREAVKASGAKDLGVGGFLSVTYTGDGPAGISKSGRPLNPPHEYRATYTPPTSQSAGFLGTASQGGGDPYAGMSPETRAALDALNAARHGR